MLINRRCGFLFLKINPIRKLSVHQVVDPPSSSMWHEAMKLAHLVICFKEHRGC